MIANKLALLGVTVISYLSQSTVADQDCSCGYRTDDKSVYTEAIETDFRTIATVASLSTDWQLQDWKVNLNTSQNIPLNRVAQSSNVIAGDSKGLQMLVRAVNGLDVGVSEIRTTRSDIKYGSFRVSMMTTSISGTCSAFFWYENDSCEIDVEILSREVNANGTPPGYANFVIHSPQSKAQGNDASQTGTFKEQAMSSNPTTDFHEYRFDWKPNTVDFSIDGNNSISWTENIPQDAGRVFLNHWSNGSPGWSGAAPTQDATTWVRYVRLYFNSTDPARISAAASRCKPGGGVCDVRSSNSPFVGSSLANGAPSSTSSRASTSTANAAPRSLHHAGLRESVFAAVMIFLADFVLSFL